MRSAECLSLVVGLWSLVVGGGPAFYLSSFRIHLLPRDRRNGQTPMPVCNAAGVDP